MEYDVIIIGAGLSGWRRRCDLTIGHKVRIFERHCFPGGLNSWYCRNGEVIDVGMHTLTNYVSAEQRGAPLNKLFRQLRLRRESWELCPQTYSLIEFPGHQLRLNNDFAAFSQEICQKFPDQAAGFQHLVEHIRNSDCFASRAPFQSARKVVSGYLTSRPLCDLLFMPLMFYVNPHVGDMDFKQFCIMFHSIYFEGFSRPKAGMKGIIQSLVKRIREAGGEVTLNNGIKTIHGDGRQITAVTDERGQTHHGKAFISCMARGKPPSSAPAPPNCLRPNRTMGFLESISDLIARRLTSA